MLIEAPFSTAKKWKGSKHTEEQRNKCSIATKGYYSALKKKEVLTHAMIWVYLEDIMLNEIT